MYITYFLMNIEISSTKAVRHFGDCLARVKLRGDTFVVMKNNKPVAEIRPTRVTKAGTLGDLFRVWKRDPGDPDFAEDLEKANSSELPRVDQWDS